ncbi:helix-turn-helix domain-containing protein [Maribacter ulvicola]|uniref:Helix-turn-helix domain-containing protein n=1 Tax=Maribacter ulvicola TaxID=228959 RepID=A0A1N6ZXQ8_9FLAO|nr:helix-turn-helix domain-containing protein [Maribacter ulvicola]SIR31595.1 Helix-turn-helix domain-containing protein [Maribacter ulvicola]
MLGRYGFIIFFVIASCSSPERVDIVYDNFEDGTFQNWNRLGVAFNKPFHVDSLRKKVENVQGHYYAFSNFEGAGLSANQGKLVSKPFIIHRKYIHFWIAGGNHETRECVNLTVNNKVVKAATGTNDYTLRKITWDVSDLEGQEAVIEVVDAIVSDFEYNSLPNILVDNFVFSDYGYPMMEIFEDFESGTYNGWEVEGDAFVTPRNRTNVYYPITPNGFNGDYFAFSFGETHDSKKGKLTSQSFIIKYDAIKFLVGGGEHKGLTSINLIVNDSIVFSQVGNNDGEMRNYEWDVTPFKGQKAKIEIVDNYSGGWGHIMVDDIIFFNKPVNFNIWKFLVFILIIVVVSYLLAKKLRFTKRNLGVVNAEEIERIENIKKILKTSEIYKEFNPDFKEIVKSTGEDEETINFLFEKADNTTLTTYLNYLRVEEFKRLLKDPGNDAYTMMHLAEKSGFNSKTSFYRVFKSITDQTPSQYKKGLN